MIDVGYISLVIGNIIYMNGCSNTGNSGNYSTTDNSRVSFYTNLAKTSNNISENFINKYF